MNKQNWIFSTSITPLPAQSKIGLCSGSDVFNSLSCKTLILPLLANWFFVLNFFPSEKNYTTYIHDWIQFFPKQMGFLTWIFLPKENNTYQKLDILDFLPTTKLNFFLATFFPCGWYAYSSIHFILCFYIEKLYVMMRKDTQWIWITESASLRNRHEMCNEWNRQTSESTRMYYVLIM